MTADEWRHAYRREVAAYPVASLRAAQILAAGRARRQCLRRPQSVLQLRPALRLRRRRAARSVRADERGLKPAQRQRAFVHHVRIVVFGAGVVGVTAAWYLAADGHEVTVVDRQPGPALETSFANGGQISASHAAPWANPRAPLTILKWLGRADAPLLFRPRMDWAQWRWAIQFLIECLPSRTLHNTIQCVNLALYSRDCLRALRATTGIEYDQLDARDSRVPHRRESLRRRGESGRADARTWRRPRSEDGRRVRGDRARARRLPRAARRRDLHRCATSPATRSASRRSSRGSPPRAASPFAGARASNRW